MKMGGGGQGGLLKKWKQSISCFPPIFHILSIASHPHLQHWSQYNLILDCWDPGNQQADCAGAP